MTDRYLVPLKVGRAAGIDSWVLDEDVFIETAADSAVAAQARVDGWLGQGVAELGWKDRPVNREFLSRTRRPVALRKYRDRHTRRPS